MNPTEEVNTGGPPEVGDILEDVWSLPVGVERLEALAEGAGRLVSRFLAFGQPAFHRLNIASERSEPWPELDMAITYDWAHQAKEFLLLWRDVAFRLHEALLALDSGKTNRSALESQSTASLELLRQAMGTLPPFRAEDPLPKEWVRACATWALQANPWPVYRDHLTVIAGQCADLVSTHRLLIDLRAEINRFGKGIGQVLDHTAEDLNNLRSQGDALQTDLAGLPEKPGKTALNKIVQRVNTLEMFTRNATAGNPFQDQLDKFLAKVPEQVLLPMALDGGRVQTRDIRLRRTFQAWFEAEMMPLLFEILETREENHSGTGILLTNIRNRLSAQVEGAGLLPLEEIRGPLQERLDFLDQSIPAIQRLGREALERYEQATQLRNLSDATRPYLALPVASSLQRMSEQSHSLGNRILRRGRRLWFSLLAWHRRALREQELSPGERALRYIRSHSPEPAADMYTSLFLTGGFIGDALLVERPHEQRRLLHCLQEWRDGYRGTVLLTGGRYSGRSMFVESFARQHFPSSTLRVQPGKTLQLGGRTLTMTDDLDAALAFISRYGLPHRSLVWIDDVETWGETGTILSRNLRALSRFMDLHATRFFVVVSHHRLLLPHIQRAYGLADTAQCHIHLDQLEVTSLQKAILIRHGATHRRLVDSEGQPASTEEILRSIRQLHRDHGGNIGATLYAWASRIRLVGDQDVRLVDPSEDDPPHLVQLNNLPLIRMLMLFRQTNEYRLRKWFGPAFDQEVAPRLRRWLSLGILLRSPEGWLEIHPAMVRTLEVQINQAIAGAHYSETLLTSHEYAL